MPKLFLELLCLRKIYAGKLIELLLVLFLRQLQVSLVFGHVLELHPSLYLVNVLVQAAEFLLL